MRTSTRWFLTILRISGAGALVLGLAFWAGYGRSLVRLHMSLGITLVLSLWLLSASAGRNGARGGLVALGIGWGLLVWALGMTQARILPGPLHGLVRLTHLVVGVSAFLIGHRLARVAPREEASPARPAQSYLGSG